MPNFLYLTLFPEIFHSYFRISMAKKALKKGILNYQVYNIRNWAIRGQADDYLYGGGSGMLLKIDCLVKALAKAYEDYGQNCHVILLSPQGKIFNQRKVPSLIEKQNLVFICGHYEGFDERILNYVDEEISVGSFVASGGEVPALLISEALIRALPGVLSKEAYQNETFLSENKFDFSAYTRPFIFEGQKVPQVLLSGHHQKIQQWRKKTSQEKQLKNKIFSPKAKMIPQANKWRLVAVKKQKKRPI